MIRVGASQETMREIKRILELEKKTKIEEQTEKETEDQTEDQTEEETDLCSKKTEKDINKETDEEYTNRIIEKYKPNKISFLTIDDENNTQVVKRDKPVIFGTGFCPCGGSITKSNKARHINSYRHQRYMDELASE